MKTIQFIICVNDKERYDDCCYYINNLVIPKGFEVTISPVINAKSMTSGYNHAMQLVEADYRVYMHQDVLILYRDFLESAISIFNANPKIGMIGIVGTKKLPENACMWSNKMRTGALFSYLPNLSVDTFDVPVSPKTGYARVEAIDGMLMMTKHDIKWRDDLFDGWDFYDISQSREFIKAGYQVVVPYQNSPWVLHDCGAINMSSYNKYRCIYLKEYDSKNENASFEIQEAVYRADKKKIQEYIQNAKYDKALEIAENIDQQAFAEDDFFAMILHLIAWKEDVNSGKKITNHYFWNGDCNKIYIHFQQLKRLLRKYEYNPDNANLSEIKGFFSKWPVSDSYIRLFVNQMCFHPEKMYYELINTVYNRDV